MARLILFCGDTENILNDENETSLADMLIEGPFKGYVVRGEDDIVVNKGIDFLSASKHWEITRQELEEFGCADY